MFLFCKSINLLFLSPRHLSILQLNNTVIPHKKDVLHQKDLLNFMYDFLKFVYKSLSLSICVTSVI